MRYLLALIGVVWLIQPGMALAQSVCNFEFEEKLVESTGADLQILGLDGNASTYDGNWTPVRLREANDRIRKFGRSIGRMDVCWENDEGKTFISYCTATLLEGNRILTNSHCTKPPRNSRIVTAGYLPVEARLLMGFESVRDTDSARYYSIILPATDASPIAEADAALFRVRGNPNKDWGFNRMVAASDITPGEALVIVHHPGGIAKMFSSIRCAVHRNQDPASQREIQHTCDTMQGSSGSLLLRESDLVIVGLHHQAGLRPDDPDSANKAIRISYVADALDLALAAPEQQNGTVTQNHCNGAATEWSGLSQSTSVTDLQSFVGRYALCSDYVLLAVSRMGELATGSDTGDTDTTVTMVAQPPRNNDADGGNGITVTPAGPDPALVRLARECDDAAGLPWHPDNLDGTASYRGILYRDDIDAPRAISTCRRAVEADPDNIRSRVHYARALAAADRNAQALRELETAIDMGDATATAMMGTMYYFGKGVAQNYATAADYYGRAARMGSPRAANNYGLMFLGGTGVTRDYATARRWFEEAIGYDFPASYSNLAVIYERGHGVARDPVRAADLYMQGIALGHRWPMTRRGGDWNNATARELQKRLRDEGFYSGAIDGAVGPGTINAMWDYQAASLP